LQSGREILRRICVIESQKWCRVESRLNQHYITVYGHRSRDDDQVDPVIAQNKNDNAGITNMSLTDFTFTDFIRFWVRLSLVLIFVEAYLTINKIWIRKHERVVSESVSVSAQLLALATGVPFIALYLMEGACEGALGDGVFLLVNVVMIMIGIGLWVEGRRDRGFCEIGGQSKIMRGRAGPA
jgi:hypothetical protein